MQNRRLRLASAFSGLALLATAGLVSTSAPAQAEPDIDDVKQRVDDLYHEAEQAQERHHDAELELDDLRDDLAGMKADERRAGRSLDGLRDDARAAFLRQYTTGGYDSLSTMMAATDPATLLDEMSAVSSYEDLQQGVFDDYAAGQKALDIRRDATEKRLDEVADLEEQLREEKDTVEEKLDEAEALLDRLEEEEREALLSRSGDVRVPSDVPASGRAAAAIQYAMAQVGDAYVYGAAGPSAFDCSGLTMMAWAQAGVALPHSSSAQYSSGTRVSADALQPGDLVFYYSPISHVGMYIGNGMIVHAANPGTGVAVAPLYSMPYVGAVRPG